MRTPDADDPAPQDALNLFDEDRVRLSQTEALGELRDDLLRSSYQPGDVRLDSGVDQPYFFDKYLMISRPAILRRLSRFMAALVPSGTERIASPTLGVVAIGTSVSLETGLPFAIVRTQWDADKRGHAVEGGLHLGETVVLIEDVVVTGSRALQPIDRLRSQGAEVQAVLCVVDCERGADARLASESVDFLSLFRYSAFSQLTEP